MKNIVETSYSIRGTNGFKAKEDEYERAIEIATDQSLDADNHTFSVVEHYAAKSVVAMIHDGVVFKPEGECDDCTADTVSEPTNETPKSNPFTDIVNAAPATSADESKKSAENSPNIFLAECKCEFCQFQRNGNGVEHRTAKQGEPRPKFIELNLNGALPELTGSPLGQLIKKALIATREREQNRAPAQKPSPVTQALHKVIDQAVIDLYRTLIYYADQAYISGEKNAINEALAELTHFQRFRELSEAQQTTLQTKKRNLEDRLQEALRYTK